MNFNANVTKTILMIAKQILEIGSKDAFRLNNKMMESNNALMEVMKMSKLKNL